MLFSINSKKYERLQNSYDDLRERYLELKRCVDGLNLFLDEFDEEIMWLRSRMETERMDKMFDIYEYLFYEWLILGKKISEEDFKKLTQEEFAGLVIEYQEFVHGLK